MKKIILMIILVFTVTLSGCDLVEPPEDKPLIDFILVDGQDTVEINSEWNDAGSTFVVGTLSFDGTSSGSVDTTTLGLYTIDYSFEYEGLSYSKTRYVIVVDSTKPNIVLNEGIDTVIVGEVWEDAGALVTDNSLEELTITVTGTVDTSIAGEYEITYTAEDSSGNIATKTRYVNVVN